MIKFTAFLCTLALLLPSFAHAAGTYGKRSFEPERVHSRHLQERSRMQVSKQNGRFQRPVSFGKSFITYKDEPHGLTIGYPPSWTLIEKYMNTVVAFISPRSNNADALTENVNVLVEKADPDLSLAQATRDALRDLDRLEHFRLIDMSDILIDRNHARSIVYTAGKSPTLKFKQVWAIHAGSLYIFTFAASLDSFRDYVRTFDRMVDSATLR